MSPFWCILAIGALFSASIAFQWAPLPKDGDVIYACKGDDVTFPWAYTLSPGEEISSIEWLFHGFSQEMIAFLSHGVFAPLPAFSGRVQQAANGGIVLSHVTTGDAGNYTVEVNVKGTIDTYRHTVILQVHSGLPTSDGQLHVHQEPDAVLDSTTQQWSLVLSCGIFNYLAEPAFPVEWLTPSGHILASTNYKDSYFHLHLANPIEDGSYTCRVPQQHVASACLHGNHNATGQASLVVDRMEARMTLMEAEVTSLRHDKLQLEQQVTVLQNNLTQKVDILDNQLTQKVDNLQNDLTQKADLNDLTQSVAVLKNNLTQQAASFNDLVHQEMGNLGHALTNIDQRMGLEVQLLRANVTDVNSELNALSALQTNTTRQLNVLETTHNRDNATLTRMIHDARTPLIGFNAQSTVAQQPSPPTHVKFNNVLYNAGQGYDSSTGDFTAPLSGAYFIIFHTQSDGSHYAYSYMKVNGNEVCRVYISSNNADHGSCHAVVHMAKGDKAWVEPYPGGMFYTDHATSFAGFLFYVDP